MEIFNLFFPFTLPQRYVLGILCFFCLVLTYTMRFCLSLAMTEMASGVVQHSEIISNDGIQHCPLPVQQLSTNSTSRPAIKEREFAWSEETQGLVLSSFFWSYVLGMVPGGMLSERFGGKPVMSIGMFVSSLMTFLTPVAARLGGAAGLIIVRVVMGLGQGLLFPSLSVLLAHWVPLEERGRFGCFVYSGTNVGSIISMGLSGVILGYSKNGWPILFYIYGFAGFVWLFVWILKGYSTPAKNPKILSSEKTYLQQYSKTVHINDEHRLPTPWCSIATSLPLWGLIIANIGHDWGFYTIINDFPKYMQSIMHLTVVQNGLLMSATHTCTWIVAIFSGWMTDYLTATKCMTVTNNRKLFTTFASVGPALGLMAASYSGCDKVLLTTTFLLGMSFMGFYYSSLKVNVLDLSSNYAGTVSSIVLCIGAISSGLTAYFIGIITPSPESTLLQWRSLFWLASAVLCVTNVVYVFTASGEVQPWNDTKLSSKDTLSTPQQAIVITVP